MWPDAYYLGSQRGSSDAWAVDRARMLIGAPATMQGFNDPGAFMLPSDLDGPTPPPPGGGAGRIYTITYSATDASMHTTSRQATVNVPANQVTEDRPAAARSPCGRGPWAVIARS